jgi:DNA-directed RNA polymerase subunit RPC12/RpoP
MKTIQFICPGCGREFSMISEAAGKSVHCTICGREKLLSEMTELEKLSLMKAGMDSGDIKFRVKVTITK